MFERFERLKLQFKKINILPKKNTRISISEIYSELSSLSKRMEKYQDIIYMDDFINDLKIVLNTIEVNNQNNNNKVLSQYPNIMNSINAINDIDIEILKISNDLVEVQKIYNEIEKADLILLDMLNKYKPYIIKRSLNLKSPVDMLDYSHSSSNTFSMHSKSVTKTEKAIMNRNGKICVMNAIARLEALQNNDLNNVIKCFKQLNETLDKKVSDDPNSEYFYYCDPFVVEDINNFVDYFCENNNSMLFNIYYNPGNLYNIDRMQKIIKFSYELNKEC